MKFKALFIGVLAAVLLLSVGCSNNNSKSTSGSDNNKTQTSTTNTKDTKQTDAAALGKFELSMIGDIHAAIKPFNDLSDLAGADSLDKAALKTDTDAAVKAGQDAAAQFKNYSLPDGLSSDTKTKLQAALKDLSTSFQQRADAAKAAANATTLDGLSKVVDNMNAASKDSFQSFSDKMNAIQKDLGLLENDFSKELSE